MRKAIDHRFLLSAMAKTAVYSAVLMPVVTDFIVFLARVFHQQLLKSTKASGRLAGWGCWSILR
jgi:hypothetical protein